MRKQKTLTTVHFRWHFQVLCPFRHFSEAKLPSRTACTMYNALCENRRKVARNSKDVFGGYNERWNISVLVLGVLRKDFITKLETENTVKTSSVSRKAVFWIKWKKVCSFLLLKPLCLYVLMKVTSTITIKEF
jgi:hypothetical protein